MTEDGDAVRDKNRFRPALSQPQSFSPICSWIFVILPSLKHFGIIGPSHRSFARCHCVCKPCCFVLSRIRNSNELGSPKPSRPMCGLLSRRIATWKSRLNVFSITMPPLSERREDIPLLVEYFIRKHSSIRGVSGITPEAMKLLKSYDWPGNVRELGNVIERAAGLGTSHLIRPEDLPEAIKERKSRISGKMKSFNDGVNDAKREMIDQALEITGGNKREAADLLDLDPSYFNRLLRTLYGENETDPPEKPLL